MSTPDFINALLLALKISGMFCGAYFVVIALFALKKRREFPECAPQTRFAVVIPARNEANVIGNLVASLRAQNYPEELYDIYVVPNNCTDDTDEAARAAGARIIRCTGPVKSKGDALRCSLDLLLKYEPKYDAFCVFDADNIADENFLSEMNRAFCAGAQVAKGRTEARNPHDSWVSGCYALYFSTFNLFYNRARAACGLSAKLIGTAFALHRDVLEESGGWRTTTIAEDAEFAAQCAVSGKRVAWVPNAVAYDEEPTSFRLSLVQRRRWCSGVMQVSRLSLPSLFAALRSGRRPLAFDFIMFLVMPFVQAVSFIPLAGSFVFSALYARTFGELALSVLLPALIYCVGTALLATVTAAQSGKLKVHILKSILMYPLFTITWLPLQTAALFKKTTKWIEIKHTGVSAAKRAQEPV